MRLDQFTSEALHNMMRHPWPNDKVARYLGIPEVAVARVRGDRVQRAPVVRTVRYRRKSRATGPSIAKRVCRWSEAQVAEIMRRADAGEAYPDIALDYGTTRSAICGLVHRTRARRS